MSLLVVATTPNDLMAGALSSVNDIYAHITVHEEYMYLFLLITREIRSLEQIKE